MEAKSVEALPPSRLAVRAPVGGFSCSPSRRGRSRPQGQVGQAARPFSPSGRGSPGEAGPSCSRELVIPIGGRRSFDALRCGSPGGEQHPQAGRRDAGDSSCATAGDPKGASLLEAPCPAARELEARSKSRCERGAAHARTRDAREAKRWLDAPRGALDGGWPSGWTGRRRGESAMLKVKGCEPPVLVGLRYGGSREVGSLLLGLYTPRAPPRSTTGVLHPAQRRTRGDDPASGGLVEGR